MAPQVPIIGGGYTTPTTNKTNNKGTGKKPVVPIIGQSGQQNVALPKLKAQEIREKSKSYNEKYGLYNRHVELMPDDGALERSTKLATYKAGRMIAQIGSKFVNTIAETVGSIGDLPEVVTSLASDGKNTKAPTTDWESTKLGDKLGAKKSYENMNRLQYIREAGKDISSKLIEKPLALDVQAETFAGRVVEDVAGGVGSMIAFLGMGEIGGVATRAIGGSAKIATIASRVVDSGMIASEALVEASGAYHQLREEGKSIDEASTAFMGSALVNALAIGITNKLGIRSKKAGKAVTRFLMSAGSEGTQEAIQTAIQNIATGKQWDRGVAYSFLIGSLTASGVELAGGVRDGVAMRPDTRDAMVQDIAGNIDSGIDPEEIRKDLEDDYGIEPVQVNELIAEGQQMAYAKKAEDIDLSPENIEKVVENARMSMEADGFEIEGTDMGIPQDIAQMIPTKVIEQANTEWENEVNAQLSSLEQRASNIENLLQQTQDQNEKDGLESELKIVEKEAEDLVSKFVKKYEREEKIKTREEEVMDEEVNQKVEEFAQTEEFIKDFQERVQPEVFESQKEIDSFYNEQVDLIKAKIKELESSNGFRQVEKDEILPSGYTTKMNISTGQQETNAPRKEDLKRIEELKKELDTIIKEKIEDEEETMQEIQDGYKEYVQQQQRRAIAEKEIDNEQNNVPDVIEYETADDVAYAMVFDAIKSGMKLSQIKDSNLAMYTDQVEASIGGKIGREEISNDFIVVYTLNGETVNDTFNIEEIFNTINEKGIEEDVVGGTTDNVNNYKRIRELQSSIIKVYKDIREAPQGSTIENNKINIEEALDEYRKGLDFRGELLNKTDSEKDVFLSNLRAKLEEQNKAVDLQKVTIQPAELALEQIKLEFELSEPGYRVFTEEGVFGVPSTFPSWIVEDSLRSRDLFNKITDRVSTINNLTFPENPRSTKQRALIDSVMTRLDSILGVNTSAMRSEILKTYETISENNEKKRQDNSAKGNTKSSKGRFTGDPVTGKAVKASEFIYEKSDTTGDDVRFKSIKYDKTTAEQRVISKEQAQEMFNEFFDDVPMVFKENVGREYGVDAFGMYLKGMVQMIENPAESTPYHEGVHAFLDLFIEKSRKEAYLKQAYTDAVSRLGKASVEQSVKEIVKARGFSITDKKARQIYAEEALAEGFFEYVQGRKQNSFLDDLYEMVKSFLQRIADSKSANRLYNDIYTKRRDFKKYVASREDAYFKATEKEILKKGEREDSIPVSVITDTSGKNIKNIYTTKNDSRNGAKDSDLIQEAKKYKSADEFINAQGETVYHGTGETFEIFDSSKLGSVTRAKSAEGALWLTDDQETAKAYSIYASEEGPVIKILEEANRLERIAQKSGDQADWARYDEMVVESERLAEYDNTFERRKNANVMDIIIPEYLKIKTLDAKGKTPQELSDQDNIDSWLNLQVENAKGKGYEGLKIKNLDDAVGLYDRPATHYAIFDLSKVKTKSQLTDIWNKAQEGNSLEIRTLEDKTAIIVKKNADIKNDVDVSESIIGTYKTYELAESKLKEIKGMDDNTSILGTVDVSFETNTDPLVEEAKKYKSAEEFIKAQGTPVYHGGTEIKEVGNMRSKWGAFYMTDNPTYAKSYGGNKSVLNKMVITKKAKLADLIKPSDDLIKQIDEIISPKATGETIKIKKPDGSFVEVPKTKGGLSNPVHSSADIIQGIKDGKAYYAEMPEVKEALKKLGYDGMITQESKFGVNYGVWNKKVIKTKSQLTDIWNKAQNTGGESSIQQAKNADNTKYVHSYESIEQNDKISSFDKFVVKKEIQAMADDLVQNGLQEGFVRVPTSNEFIKEYRSDVRTVTDSTGKEWYETTVTIADTADIPMFMHKKIDELVENVSLLENPDTTIANFGDTIGSIRISPAVLRDPQLLAEFMKKHIAHVPKWSPVQASASNELVDTMRSFTAFNRNEFIKKIVLDKKVYEELKNLTQIRVAFDEKTSPRAYIKYRYDGGQMYDEYVSELFNNPELARRVAPTFTKMWYETITTNEEMQKMYSSLGNMIGSGIAPVIVPKTQREATQLPVYVEGNMKDSKAFSRVKDQLSNEYATMDVKYNEMKIVNDTAMAMNYIEQNRQDAIDVALGLIDPPIGITETAISIALSEKARLEGDYALQAEIEKAHSMRQTRRGQEIVAERGRVNENSASHFLQMLIDARFEMAGKKFKIDFKDGVSHKKKINKDIDESVKIQKQKRKKEMTSIQLAQEIINELTC